MKFALTDVMLTGIKAIDDDHLDLIAHVNAIHEREQAGNTAALLAALSEFKADLARHFAAEEVHMRAANFPDVGLHGSHHAEMLATLDRLMQDVARGKSADGEVARDCYHELVSVLLLKDMQFVNWLADRGRR